MITAGIDVGAGTTKVVLMDEGRILARSSLVLTGFDQIEAASKAMAEALAAAGLKQEEVRCIIATGAGAAAVPFAHESVTDVKAAARGACFFFPSARTVIDVGAEEGRGIRCDAQGRVVDFAVNDRCAAGAGAFIEAIARALEVRLEDMGALSLQSQNGVPLNAQCVVFAESEVVSLVHAQTPRPDVVRAVHEAMAGRIGSMVRRVGLEPDVVLMGGVARNMGLVDALSRNLEIKILVPEAPDYVAAVGAALSSTRRIQKIHGRGTKDAENPDIKISPAVEKEILACGQHGRKAEEKQEYWRWKEYNWRDPAIDPKAARVITAGVDVGSVSTQAVIMTDGKLYAYANMRTGSDSPASARKAMGWALEGTGLTLADIQYCVGTGYGRVNVPFAQRAITEIACHARGANFIYGPTVRTVLDMGGQDCKVIRCDEQGQVIAFLMNDKCAAGTGRGLEVMADLLSVPIEEMGSMSLDVDQEPPMVSSTCVVFGKSEAMGLLRRGWPKTRVLAAFHAAMAHRVVNLIERIGVERDFAITGGISKNMGMVARITRELGIEPLKTGYDAQMAGGIGAALLAHTLLMKGRGGR